MGASFGYVINVVNALGEGNEGMHALSRIPPETKYRLWKVPCLTEREAVVRHGILLQSYSHSLGRMFFLRAAVSSISNESMSRRSTLPVVIVHLEWTGSNFLGNPAFTMHGAIHKAENDPRISAERSKRSRYADRWEEVSACLPLTA